MFDFSRHMKNLIIHISQFCEDFDHIDSRKILVAISQSRNNRKYGLQAKLVPLKFQEGRRIIHASGDWYCKMPPLIHEGHEILYVIYFCLPRFQNLSFKEKMVIVFHELYHISPSFNGDIRRFPGKYYQHSKSEKEYDKIVQLLSENYIQSARSGEFSSFLRYDFEELKQKYGGVSGLRRRLPEPILFKRSRARM